MTKLVFAAAVAVAWGTSVASGAAQQRLRMKVQDVIGSITLEQAGYGCFDPLAALRFDSDLAGGKVSAATRHAFELGSCVVLPEGLELIGVARLSLEGQIFVRGDVADSGVTAYLPDWAAAIDGVDDGYNSEYMELASSVDEIDTALRSTIADYRQCERDGVALEASIINYNERAEAADPTRSPTGSRFGSASTSPVFQVIMPDEEYRALFAEAEQLHAEVNAFWKKCAVYRKNFTLDKDYLAFIEATE